MERVLLIGIRRPRQTRAAMERSLDELARLVDTAGGTVVGVVSQEIRRASPATLIHEGKVEEVRLQLASPPTGTVILDDELSPAQQRNLTAAWGCKVLDRTALILDIFAQRAHTQAGKLQVELAQLQYRLPRLVGEKTGLMQQAGHIGNRGPGETRLEIDRRRIRDRITGLRHDLAHLRQHRALHRARRTGLPLVALVGYTNAGKSTLMNRLTGAGLLAEDTLFATLDPTVRRLRLPSGREVLLADTVGFIQRLPHHVVEAFQATFEEVARADLLCHLLDASAPDMLEQEQTVHDVLAQLNIRLPMFTVLTKTDLQAAPSQGTPAAQSLLYRPKSVVAISALTGHGIPALLAAIQSHLDQALVPVALVIPHQEGQLLSAIYKSGHVEEVAHREDGVFVRARVPQELADRLRAYGVE